MNPRERILAIKLIERSKKDQDLFKKLNIQVGTCSYKGNGVTQCERRKVNG